MTTELFITFSSIFAGLALGYCFFYLIPMARIMREKWDYEDQIFQLKRTAFGEIEFSLEKHITVEWLQNCDYFQYSNGVSWSSDEEGSDFQICDDDGVWNVYYNRQYIRELEYVHEFELLFYSVKGIFINDYKNYEL